MFLELGILSGQSFTTGPTITPKVLDLAHVANAVTEAILVAYWWLQVWVQLTDIPWLLVTGKKQKRKIKELTIPYKHDQ